MTKRKDSLFIFNSNKIDKKFSHWQGYGNDLEDYYMGDSLEEWNKFINKYRARPTFGFISYELLYKFKEFKNLSKPRYETQEFRFPFIWWGVFKDSILTVQDSRAKVKKRWFDYDCGDNFKLISSLCPNISSDDYISKVKQIKKHIENGDVYQVNLSFRISGKYKGSPLFLYKKMNNKFFLPYSVFFSLDKLSFFALTPELLLLKNGDTIYTRPIKGTLPRKGNSFQTARCYFKNSVKDRRELDMIIDVERNDFYKVCSVDSVKVVDKRLEVFPNVYHMVATVTGKLYSGITLSRLIEAIFPSASVTGAPKSSAIKIISCLEPHRRFIYTGGIGFHYNDLFVLAMGLRCIVFRNNNFYIYTGSGITSLSDPYQELKECKVKINNYENLFSTFNY